MPKLTGLETLERVRQMKSQMKSLLPCILISAGLDESIIRRAELAQAFSILAKPVSRRQITSVVDAALRRTYNWPNDVPDDPMHRV